MLLSDLTKDLLHLIVLHSLKEHVTTVVVLEELKGAFKGVHEDYPLASAFLDYDQVVIFGNAPMFEENMDMVPLDKWRSAMPRRSGRLRLYRLSKTFELSLNRSSVSSSSARRAFKRMTPVFGGPGPRAIPSRPSSAFRSCGSIAHSSFPGLPMQWKSSCKTNLAMVSSFGSRLPVARLCKKSCSRAELEPRDCFLIDCRRSTGASLGLARALCRFSS